MHFSEKLFSVIEAINETSATNSVMNLSHTLFVIADAKGLCSILYSSGNIQKNNAGIPPPVTLSWHEPLYPEG